LRSASCTPQRLKTAFCQLYVTAGGTPQAPLVTYAYRNTKKPDKISGAPDILSGFIMRL